MKPPRAINTKITFRFNGLALISIDDAGPLLVLDDHRGV